MTPPLLNRKNMEDMVFNFLTTTRSDYRDGEIKPLSHIEPKEKRMCFLERQLHPPPLKGIYTLTKWKEAPVSFSFTHKPKDIVNTDPRNIQEAYSKPIDLEKDEVRKTRPRLVMTPAVSMDDIVDPAARDILVEDMYTSNMARGTREAVSAYFQVRAPLPGRPAPANPITLPRLQPPKVPLEWRKESVKWDLNGLRSYCDPTKEFWKSNSSVYKCDRCQETRDVEAHLKMMQSMKPPRN